MMINIERIRGDFKRLVPACFAYVQLIPSLFCSRNLKYQGTSAQNEVVDERYSVITGIERLKRHISKSLFLLAPHASWQSRVCLEVATSTTRVPRLETKELMTGAGGLLTNRGVDP